MEKKRIETVEILGHRIRVSTDLTEEKFEKVVKLVSDITNFFKNKEKDATITETLILTCLKLSEDYLNALEKMEATKSDIGRGLDHLIKLFENEVL